MKTSTRNKHLLKLLGKGYIIYLPEKDGNGYSVLSNSANPDMLTKIKEVIGVNYEFKR